MDVTAPVEIGSDFLGYRIEELLGRGGMGVVYRAYDLRLKRPVALKLVAPALAHDERFRERFARESELVMSLEHPNVVPIHDAGDLDGRVYLAMRLVEGSDLGSLLRAEGALEPARAIAICAQIASALDAAHARGLVHRDVKPSNVLLDASEHVYLADFGLTHRLDDEGSGPGLDRSIGTPAYLAPEQLESGPVDGSADVYSLGCVLYECLTGEPVFPRDSRLAVAWAHLEDEPPKASNGRPELPQGTDAVVGKALAKEPEQRYPTCGALVADAQEALGLGAPRTSRQRQTLLLAGAAGLALVAAAVVIAVSLTDGAGRGAAARLLAGPNTLVRVDAATKKVAKVIPIGPDPVVAAASGRRIWVYNEGNGYTQGSGTISEINTRTDRMIETKAVPLLPPAECCGLYSGPVLAANASGAWFVTGGLVGKARLVHLPPGQRAKLPYPLDITPTGVAVGDGSVWVVGHTPSKDEVQRVDPANGHVTAKMRFPLSARINSIAFGYRRVWLVSSATATLYRLDPQLRRPTRIAMSGRPATRPELIDGYVWLRVKGDNGLNRWWNPSVPLKKGLYHWEPDGPIENEENVWAFGDLWWYDAPKGAVYWKNGVDNMPGDGSQSLPDPHRIPVTRTLPTEGGPCITSITTAGRGIWVTVAPLPQQGQFACRH